eukprot:1144353-Pelagomonas_calceolata.AAC.4
MDRVACARADAFAVVHFIRTTRKATECTASLHQSTQKITLILPTSSWVACARISIMAFSSESAAKADLPWWPASEKDTVLEKVHVLSRGGGGAESKTIPKLTG